MPAGLASIAGASMGPHFFKCGKLIAGVVGGNQLLASMGPHFFKCGKASQQIKILDTFASASMGPHFFKCGKSAEKDPEKRANLGFNGAALFQVRKERREESHPELNPMLQWGRTFSSAESAAHGAPRINGIVLQWGRTFSSAERCLNILDFNCRVIASMGPHFFKCGKRHRYAGAVACDNCFNGAALFQVRKATSWMQ